MPRPVRTAILPVAGRGTRLLPATRAVPKELLPVLDKPLIDFAVEEAVAAGIERLVFVSSPEKESIRRHVIGGLSAAAPDGPEIIFVDQPRPLGLGHAVLCAQPYVLPGAVSVILPDDLILGPVGALSELICAYAGAGTGNLVAAMTVSPDQVGRYGILDVTDERAPLLVARSLIEKPEIRAAPSRDAVVGRYVLDPCIFCAILEARPGAGGEIQLTDAIAATASDVGLAGLRFSGVRFDCGSREGFLAATIYRAGVDPEFRKCLESSFANMGFASAA